MAAVEKLVTDHLELWTAAIKRKSSAGRGSSSKVELYGMKKLRELILELAVRGLLVPQDVRDEPASNLLKLIFAEKAKLIGEGKFKKDRAMSAISEEELPFVLPQGWIWVRLGEITNFGATVKLNCIDSNSWVLDLEDIEKDTSNLLRKIRFDERASLSNKNSFRKDDVLYGKLRPYLNKVIVADEDGVCTTEILPIRCYGPFNSNYFKNVLKSPYFLEYVNRKSYGMKMPRLGTEDGRQALFPLPSLAEQHRIAVKVDELMARCDLLEQQTSASLTAHQTLVKTLLSVLTSAADHMQFASAWQRISKHFDTLFTTDESIEQLKQTILQLAVLGKLVAQDPSDEPASELLKKIAVEKATLKKEGRSKKEKLLLPIDDAKKPFQLPKGWAWARFPELGEFGRGKSKHRPRNDPKLFIPGIYPLVQTGEVARANDVIAEYHSKYSDLGLAQSRMWPAGTLCITIAANIADSALLGFDACFPDSVVGFIPCKPLGNANYFLTFMKTARAELLKFAPATAQKNINLEILESILIPIPPKEEIERISSKVAELITLCDQLKSRLSDAQITQLHFAEAMAENALART